MASKAAPLRESSREHLLARYLRGEVTRQQAIEEIGIERVELAERQLAAMREDLAWAMRDWARS